MENIEIDGTTVENIISSEKLYSYGMTLLAIVLMIACGFAVTKIILKITDKALKKSTADPILYTFVRNVIRVAAIIIIATMCHTDTHYNSCSWSCRRCYSACAQRQSREYSRRRHDNHHQAFREG